jgi:hypothetical protein
MISVRKHQTMSSICNVRDRNHHFFHTMMGKCYIYRTGIRGLLSVCYFLTCKAVLKQIVYGLHVRFCISSFVAYQLSPSTKSVTTQNIKVLRYYMVLMSLLLHSYDLINIHVHARGHTHTHTHTQTHTKSYPLLIK